MHAANSLPGLADAARGARDSGAQPPRRVFFFLFSPPRPKSKCSIAVGGESGCIILPKLPSPTGSIGCLGCVAAAPYYHCSQRAAGRWLQTRQRTRPRCGRQGSLARWYARFTTVRVIRSSTCSAGGAWRIFMLRPAASQAFDFALFFTFMPNGSFFGIVALSVFSRASYLKYRFLSSTSLAAARVHPSSPVH